MEEERKKTKYEDSHWVIQNFNLQDENVINIYPYGSRVYGTASVTILFPRSLDHIYTLGKQRLGLHYRATWRTGYRGDKGRNRHWDWRHHDEWGMLHATTPATHPSRIGMHFPQARTSHPPTKRVPYHHWPRPTTKDHLRSNRSCLVCFLSLKSWKWLIKSC